MHTGKRFRRAEQELQRLCVQFFDVAVGDRGIFIAIPNGEKRDRITAAILKGLGVRAGAPDAIIVCSGGRTLWVEFKRPEIDAPEGTLARGRQSESQRNMQRKLESLGHTYRIIDSVDGFAALMREFGLTYSAKAV